MSDEARAGDTPQPGSAEPFDKALLKKAMRAFRKRLKLLRLDEESRISGPAMSGGRRSSIVGIVPPDQFSREVWDELVRLGRLKKSGHGMYELAGE